MSDESNTDLVAILTERLKQVERERDEFKNADQHHFKAYTKTLAERDALKPELMDHYRRANRMENQRDAALADLEKEKAMYASAQSAREAAHKARDAALAQRDSALQDRLPFAEKYALHQTAERDAALAQVEELLQQRGKLTEARDAALAKADEWCKIASDEQLQHGATRAKLAEMEREMLPLRNRIGNTDDALNEALARAETADKLALKCDSLQVWLNLLTARIEGLAKEWDVDLGHMRLSYAASRLRAVLKPPQPESALDVLSRLEQHADAVWGNNEGLVRDDFAKLRALLESSQP